MNAKKKFYILGQKIQYIVIGCGRRGSKQFMVKETETGR